MGMRINDKLEEYANSILVSNDMLKLPVDLTRIAANCDIDVYEKDLPDAISGAIRYNQNKNKFEILLNKQDPENRKRFSFAHELAHFFLTQQKLIEAGDPHIDTRFRIAGSGYSDKEEADANYLAGALLMDRSLIGLIYKKVCAISELAKIFEVSESAMTVRLMELGLLTG